MINSGLAAREAPIEHGLAVGACQGAQALELRLRMFLGRLHGLLPKDDYSLPPLPDDLSLTSLLTHTVTTQTLASKVLSALEDMVRGDMKASRA